MASPNFKCPHCGGNNFAIYTRLLVIQQSDSWRVETPFEYEDTDECSCEDCGAEMTVSELEVAV